MTSTKNLKVSLKFPDGLVVDKSLYLQNNSSLGTNTSIDECSRDVPVSNRRLQADPRPARPGARSGRDGGREASGGWDGRACVCLRAGLCTLRTTCTRTPRHQPRARLEPCLQVTHRKPISVWVKTPKSGVTMTTFEQINVFSLVRRHRIFCLRLF